MVRGSGNVGLPRLLLVTSCPSSLKSFLPSTETVSGLYPIDLFSISMMIQMIDRSASIEHPSLFFIAIAADERGE